MLYGSGNFTIKVTDTRRITTTEMKCMRITGGYARKDYKSNTDTAKDLNITPGLDKIQEYIRNWSQHTNRMPLNRLRRKPKTTDQQAEEIRGKH